MAERRRASAARREGTTADMRVTKHSKTPFSQLPFSAKGMSIAALCCRCRFSLEQPSFLFLQKRFRRKFASNKLNLPQKRSRQSPIQSKLIPSPTSLDDIPSFFARNVKAWLSNPRCESRLREFGIPAPYARPLLDSFVDAVTDGQLCKEDEDWEKYGLARFGRDLLELSPEGAQTEMDIIYSTIFFTWASDPKHQENLIRVLRHQTAASNAKSLDIMTHIRRLSRVASRRYPAEEYPAARQMRRRIIMHVGPTNSGKTHCALRALAASPSGVYAGPLRLLAHEVWERLNLGEITPLGVDGSPPRPNIESRTSDGLPNYLQSHPNLLRAFDTSNRGNLAYMRPCNLVTGEEHRIVSASAPLVSCTVEMLSMKRPYDVAVVDEIQMISDTQRGAGWTSAVLGLCAHEIHLCGEETAVPLVQALLRETGDEIEIRRYERLTTLDVEGRSIEGDYGNIEKGDCVVAFSRSGIFSIKTAIEKKTGMKCAVVYGKLPPEVRSEQARLFNDPSSGYNVIIGSDAIGMGLNLSVILPFVIHVIHHSFRLGRFEESFSTLQPSAVKAECNPFQYPRSSRSLVAQDVMGYFALHLLTLNALLLKPHLLEGTSLRCFSQISLSFGVPLRHQSNLSVMHVWGSEQKYLKLWPMFCQQTPRRSPYTKLISMLVV